MSEEKKQRLKECEKKIIVKLIKADSLNLVTKKCMTIHNKPLILLTFFIFIIFIDF